jgi:stage II sporulation protein R
MVIRHPNSHSYSYKFPYRASYGYVILAIMMLVMSWESMKSDAAVASGAIPEESIRLRILANSDSPADQAVKRHIRDAVVADMQRYATQSHTIEEARQDIASRLPAIEELVRDELAKRGFRYAVKAELGTVPFPTKMYGGTVYPAGDYEALRITLGAGDGQNWWCVLFPPLCFVDSVSGEAAEVQTAAASAAAAQQDGDVEQQTASAPEKPEVKFFLWELLQKIGEFISKLFS